MEDGADRWKRPSTNRRGQDGPSGRAIGPAGAEASWLLLQVLDRKKQPLL